MSLRLLPRLLAAAAFGAAMLALRAYCSQWSYPALFLAMYVAVGILVIAIVLGGRRVDRWLDQRQNLQNDKGPASPGL